MGKGLSAGFLIGVEHVQNAVTVAGAQVADEEAALGFQLFQGGHMALGQVHHVDIVPDAGAVRGVIVISVDMDFFQLAHGDFRNIGHQIVGNAVGVLSDEAGLVGPNGVEVAKQSHV